jgi:PAS domain S-box-containing protein
MHGLPKKQAQLRAKPASDDPLLKSEEWLRLAAKGSPMGLGLWYWNEETKNFFWDAKACEIFGVELAGQIPLATFYRSLHPDDRERVVKVWRHQFEKRLPCDLEYRTARPDGSIRWVRTLGSGYYDELGTPLRMVGVVFDVTERKAADQERLDLAGRLINAQEQERSRLARELHDDFSQRLAMLAQDLEQAEEMVKEPELREDLLKLLSQVGEIRTDLYSVSHRLHSSTLETLGLTAGVESFCAEFSSQHAIEVEFVHKGVPKSTNPDTALCLFRIVQEGLRNVISHSRATKVDVWLQGSAETICLTLSDNGVGFKLSDCVASHGIGLRSMRERVRILDGTFTVQSQPGQGTRIAVTVPLGSGNSAMAISSGN